jgi:hypothetical protein
MLSSFLLRFPDASTEAAINEVHRWLVGRVIVLLRDTSESSPQAGPSGALSLTPRGEDRGEDADLLEEHKQKAASIIEQSRPRDW